MRVKQLIKVVGLSTQIMIQTSGSRKTLFNGEARDLSRCNPKLMQKRVKELFTLERDGFMLIVFTREKADIEH